VVQVVTTDDEVRTGANGTILRIELGGSHSV
jgi:hypothetical protein